MIPLPLFGKACGAALLVGVCAVVYAPVLLPAGWALAAVVLGVGAWLCWPRGRCCGALLLGLGWAALHGHARLDAQLTVDDAKRSWTLQGRVIDLPRHGERSTRFTLRVDNNAEIPAALRGRDLVLNWHDPRNGDARSARHQVKAGSRWSLQARLRPPRGLRNPGGFDAERHALLQGIVGTGSVTAPDRARPLAPPTGLPAWRERMAAAIARQVQGESARFIQALALGDTRRLTPQDWDTLRALGLTHLIAISGLHVTMVSFAAGWLTAQGWRFVAPLSRRCPCHVAGAVVGVLAALLYAAVAGFALPTVRTVLMVAVLAAATCSRRPAPTGQLLALAVWAVLAFDPLSVLAPGFWLSFGGVLWLMWCLQERMARVRAFLAAQAVATLALIPLTVAMFGQASRAGPLVNLLAIPCWGSVVVPLALIGTALEALVDGAGHWPWHLAAWCFELSWQLFGRVAEQPWALWWVPQSAPWALPLALLGVFWLLLPRAAGARLPAALLCLPLLWPLPATLEAGEVELQVIDVGQGLAVWVRTRRHTLLYDAGPATAGGFDAGERVVVPALQAVGMAHVDRVLLSHIDRDHAGGLGAVRRAFPEASVQAPPGAPQDAAACHAGQYWQWDAVRFQLLHPAPGSAYDGNASSCVLRIETPHGAVLLAGDIGHREEAALLRDSAGTLRADVVVVPHHGSAGSSSPAWIEAVSPRLALVSAGYGNRFRHPRPEVVARWQAAGAEVLNTADSGALRVWLGPQGLQVREQRLFERRWWDAAEQARSAAILSASKQAASGPEG